ncbi:EAL domain-containing protein [Sinimarinibacterium sp. CAU 1509]|uniref:EAL domain-containing protein n=1 Tax=Sinimarinibacterium sp. CAU 1509 TaxID=2562283 RepID=UPI00146F1A8F|nr:EAL domain-containing protein [Sinimarinibacterium sp. CAU 1509]
MSSPTLPRSLIRMLGRRRARTLVGWSLLTVTTAAIALVIALLFDVIVARLPEMADLPVSLSWLRAHFPIIVFWLLFLISARIVWKEYEQEPQVAARASLRRHLGRQRKRSALHSQTELTTAEQRTQQLGAVLQMNRSLRERLARTLADQQGGIKLRDSLLNMAQEALLMTDAAGVVLGASPAAATLLRCPRESLIGRRFADSVPLYQDDREQFRDYPLANFLTRVLESTSSIPQIQQARLLNHENEPVPVIVTSSSVVDVKNAPLGAIVRINRSDSESAPASAPHPGLSLADAEMENWTTTLLSREPFERRIDELLAEAKSAGTQHVALFLRIDDLDHINDEKGYWAGEQALWHAAKNLAMSIVESGTGYRYSNARFAALLIGHDEARAAEVAERVRLHAENNDLIWNGQQIRCTFSIALVPITRETNERAELLAAAETLLSEAKNRGGNQVLQRIPDEAAKNRHRDDQVWLDWLLPRMKDGRAHLISQEMRPLTEPDGLPLMEFFIRVEDDDGVWLEPGHYLPAVERLRQSHRVDLWTLQSLITAAANNPRILESHVAVSLNLAPSSLLEPEFGTSVFELLAAADVPAEKLCLEIGEAFAINQTSVVQRFMELLRPTGVRFALDRCHTTMGVTQLRHLPFDYMKIHPSVTANISHDALDRTHLEWICKAAHLLNRRTAAINIESTDAVDWLKSAGVDYVQGSAINKMGSVMI